jgi:dihydroorotase
MRVAVMFDLLVKGGHVLDPGQGLDGRLDIAIAAGRIAAMESVFPASQAHRTLEIRGANRRVVPGLIDLHTHVAYGATTPGVGLDCCEPGADGIGQYARVRGQQRKLDEVN